MSWRIWRSVARRCNMQPLRSWDQSINQMISLSSGKLWRRLSLIAWQASIYWIWSERNGRLHRGVFKTENSIVTSIDRQIRNRIASYRESNTGLASRLLQLWLSSAP
ncbi:unnamed protein product [Microthlaspi erraticum]|uniref:Reverse transcriptase zinc-binding domain-containing protein n=1 Tax=Microthlaspi erraticum TaxID=1685480 RepID=A0A6D2IGH4_9BRAS|nr:unnamed protein product [Microthlaspi erraticum]CAA7043610.1 unnamed protein product [Microthlaspi erraticum]